MRKKTVAVTTTVIALAATAGIASAGWRVPGVAASTVEASDPRLDVMATPVTGLYPGGTVNTVLDVSNPNTFPVLFGRVLLDYVEADPAHPGCSPSVLSVVFPDPQVVILPQSGMQFEVGVTMADDAPQDCAGARFNVGYMAEGTVGTVTP